ncbi:PilZ domain-containing protein [uncultured Sphingomonas sp.]|uniref:PilZ domain-containing protein n=1 Tax=uncultured Sphingomonas sp. TaxID=158754 RepID=UPI0035CA80CB
MASRIQDLTNGRSESRDEVHHRARAIAPDGRPANLLIVNISAGGLMLRSDEEFGIGEVVRVTLPLVGAVAAEVRWSLGGRIGCRFDRTVALADYDALLAALRKA